MGMSTGCVVMWNRSRVVRDMDREEVVVEKVDTTAPIVVETLSPSSTFFPERVLVMTGMGVGVCVGLIFLGYLYVRLRTTLVILRIGVRRLFRRSTPVGSASAASAVDVPNYDSDDEGIPGEEEVKKNV